MKYFTDKSIEIKKGILKLDIMHPERGKYHL